MMISISQKGDFSKTNTFLSKALKKDTMAVLHRFGEQGVAALRSATPVRTGKTADSWSYEIIQNGNKTSIFWTNSNVNNHVNVAVVIQYGHGTGTGGYVQGIDYINPAIRPIFDNIAEAVWKEVMR